MPRDHRRREWTKETFSGPAGGPFRRHLNPIQFAVNPLGAQNLYGYRARDFSDRRANPAKFARAIGILGKLVSSKGSQAKHRIRKHGFDYMCQADMDAELARREREWEKEDA